MSVWCRTQKEKKYVLTRKSDANLSAACFHIIPNSSPLHSNLQRQNTSAFIKSSHTLIQLGFFSSMGSLSVFSIGRYKQWLMTTVSRIEVNKAFFSWRGFERRSHAAEHEIGLLFFPGKNQQFCRIPEKVFLVEEKKIWHARWFQRIQNSGGKCPFSVRMEGRRLHGLLTRFGKGLYGTWLDKKKKTKTLMHIEG